MVSIVCLFIVHNEDHNPFWGFVNPMNLNSQQNYVVNKRKEKK
ncbi:hypothetical protein ECDEC5C_0320 [Escherichia coli DEC5C]|nr:hypothetical protein ECDEC5B_0468 [Escherichia coli DEC5B]EHV44523.1 hypothetical protein ECDEC5D_0626 [Escherichia coli DEC5D]EHV45286.1 hypothetical protein ECDEC5C_0320 [Escherichia coli DEC5C]EHV51544.1 hypothetical protein ECDEC5E_0118 [Escherichia coli DEC5E]EKI01906.1 hypothetical protein EC5905_0577 [Escherichia coli 5905]